MFSSTFKICFTIKVVCGQILLMSIEFLGEDLFFEDSRCYRCYMFNSVSLYAIIRIHYTDHFACRILTFINFTCDARVLPLSVYAVLNPSRRIYARSFLSNARPFVDSPRIQSVSQREAARSRS